jgi:hypothetical protein
LPSPPTPRPPPPPTPRASPRFSQFPLHAFPTAVPSVHLNGAKQESQYN